MSRYKPKKFMTIGMRDWIYIIFLLFLLIPIYSGTPWKNGVGWINFKYLVGKCKNNKECHVALAKAFPACFAENAVWDGKGWSEGIKNVDCVERKTGFKFKENDPP